jgi:hypothetical protein
MTKLFGYMFLLLGIILLVLGINQLGIYLKHPDQFPIYHYLVNLPESERSMQLEAGAVILPTGLFKISGMMSILLAGFLLVAVVRLLVSSGVSMISSNTRDLARQLIAEVKKIEKIDV